MTNRMLTVLFVASACLGPRSFAQTATPTLSTMNSAAGIDRDIQLLRLDIRSQKKQLIAANLKLTDAEATKFWPVYDRYTADLVKINDEKYAVLKEYADEWATMTDTQAIDLAKRRGIEVIIADDRECIALMAQFIAENPKLWNEDIMEDE